MFWSKITRHQYVDFVAQFNLATSSAEAIATKFSFNPIRLEFFDFTAGPVVWDRVFGCRRSS
jgi:hypothetical protein